MSENGVSRPKQERIDHSAAEHPQSEIADKIAGRPLISDDGSDVLPSTYVRTNMAVEADQHFLTHRARHKCNDDPRCRSNGGGCARGFGKHDCSVSLEWSFQAQQQ